MSSSSSSGSSSWADLPEHLLDHVLNKLISIYDYLHFSIVCKSWRSVALHNKHLRRHITATSPQLPMLIVPSEEEAIEGKYGLHDVVNNRTREFPVKELHSKSCCGSSHGWLIMVDETLHITLLNPFSGITICLPQPIEYVSNVDEPYGYKRHVKKAILTCDPCLNPRDYAVVAICASRQRLALFKSGDETWTYLESGWLFHDVIFHRGSIHVVNRTTGLWKVEDQTASLNKNNIVQSSRFEFKLVKQPFVPRMERLIIDSIYASKLYLVESSRGELLVIRRFYAMDDDYIIARSTTLHFEVCKLIYITEDDGHHKCQTPKYLEMETLDNDVMFVGSKNSMCVSSEEFLGCVSNCIYYTDDYKTHPSHKDLPHPIWIVPTLE